MDLFPVAGLVDAFRLSNLAGQVIVIVLVLGSMFAWTTMVVKWRELRDARAGARRFLQAYRKEASPLGLFLKRHHFERNPLCAVYEGSCRSIARMFDEPGRKPAASGAGGGPLFASLRLSGLQVNAVRGAAESALSEQALALENGMNALAIAVSAAPLLGLLGTVWGVLDSFGVMTTAGSAMLSAVAPGISGALLTTVIGLLVALPSAIAYNVLTEQIRRLCVAGESFVEELVSDIERHGQTVREDA